MMRAFSIRQPWAYAILHLGKDIENRTWPLPLWARNEWLWLHTGRRHDGRIAWQVIEQVTGKRPPPASKLPMGAVVGLVMFSSSVDMLVGPNPLLAGQRLDAKKARQSVWCAGDQHAWLIRAALPTPEIERLPVSGRLGFWVPRELGPESNAGDLRDTLLAAHAEGNP